MHSVQPAVRRLLAVASFGLVAAFLSGLAAPAGAQITSGSLCGAGAPVLELGNPNPGDVLSSGDIIISGVAYDPTAGSGTGITSVDLFLGTRESGGVALGSAMLGQSTLSTDPRAFSLKVKIPSGISGGRNFLAYATSSRTGRQTTVSVPIFIGAAPTSTPTGGSGATPVPLSATTTSNCPGGTTSTTTSASGTAQRGPVLSLGNPNPGDVLNGSFIVQGTAYDPAAPSGSGVDSVTLFIDSREAGGTPIGTGTPGDVNNPGGRTFSIKASLPTTGLSGGHQFVVYARSSATGQETSVSVPIFIGAAPTATPRPSGG